MSQPSISNEFTIQRGYNADSIEENEAARTIQLLKQEIETWKEKSRKGMQNLVNVKARAAKNFEDRIKLLNEEIHTLEQWKESYRTENTTLWKEVERLKSEVERLKAQLGSKQ